MWRGGLAWRQGPVQAEGDEQGGEKGDQAHAGDLAGWGGGCLAWRMQRFILALSLLTAPALVAAQPAAPPAPITSQPAAPVPKLPETPLQLVASLPELAAGWRRGEVTDFEARPNGAGLGAAAEYRPAAGGPGVATVYRYDRGLEPAAAVASLEAELSQAVREVEILGPHRRYRVDGRLPAEPVPGPDGQPRCAARPWAWPSRAATGRRASSASAWCGAAS